MEEVIKRAEVFVEGLCKEDSSGHDYEHILRVRNLSGYIQKYEGGNLFVVDLSALLHDVDDWKLSPGYKALDFLESQALEPGVLTEVYYILNTISFKGIDKEKELKTIESKIVQDADRLDATGAIGIARAFAYGGSTNRRMYETLRHFDEKLLHLKDLMNTKTAKRLAQERHDFMLRFLKQFDEERNC